MNRFRTSANSIVIFIAALGMMCTLMSVEVNGLATWAEVTTPTFIGTLLAHLGTVIGAYVAGTLMPENRVNKTTRRDDPK